MVLKLQCPECGKSEKSEVVEILSDRRYKMKCRNCECIYILAASKGEELNCNTSDKESS